MLSWQPVLRSSEPIPQTSEPVLPSAEHVLPSSEPALSLQARFELSFKLGCIDRCTAYLLHFADPSSGTWRIYIKVSGPTELHKEHE